jgi:hypothetical protein
MGVYPLKESRMATKIEWVGGPKPQPPQPSRPVVNLNDELDVDAEADEQAWRAVADRLGDGHEWIAWHAVGNRCPVCRSLYQDRPLVTKLAHHEQNLMLEGRVYSEGKESLWYVEWFHCGTHIWVQVTEGWVHYLNDTCGPWRQSDG